MRYFFLLIFFITTVPHLTAAASLVLHPQEVPVKTGDLQTVSLSVRDSMETLNAAEGVLAFDPAALELVEVKTNSSVISFWVTYPALCGAGKICFSGITPGGFGGGSNDIVSVVFLPKTSGTTTIAVDPIRLLRHDGKGTDEPVSPTLIQMYVEENDYDDVEPGVLDTEAPEAFTPLLVTNPDLYDGAYSILFNTTDKQSGIAGYYVKEVPVWLPAWLMSWQEARSPYRLNDQERKRRVLVKAVDSYGNERVMMIEPVIDNSWVRVIVAVVVLLTILVLLQRSRKPQDVR